MVLDSGRTGQQCTRPRHRAGPSSCSSWSREVQQLTSWQSTPSPPCMRRVYRDRPNASDCCWMLVHRWDGVSATTEMLHWRLKPSWWLPSSVHDWLTGVFFLWLCDLQVDARNIDGSTPLCDACAAGSLECVKLLLEYGATVNPPLFTFSPLHEACMGGVSCYSTYNITQECVVSHVSIRMSLLHHSAFVLMQEKSRVELVIFLKRKKKGNESSGLKYTKFLSILCKYCWEYILHIWLMFYPVGKHYPTLESPVIANFENFSQTLWLGWPKSTWQQNMGSRMQYQSSWLLSSWLLLKSLPRCSNKTKT